mmetsp:Transcript_4153/g.9032  ORF Transcript_4153/g.9032 Transcript_4153/m.9032 type:complete len:229 (+) Transcript_4153:582-1268(+)
MQEITNALIEFHLGIDISHDRSARFAMPKSLVGGVIGEHLQARLKGATLHPELADGGHWIEGGSSACTRSIDKPTVHPFEQQQQSIKGGSGCRCSRGRGCECGLRCCCRRCCCCRLIIDIHLSTSRGWDSAPRPPCVLLRIPQPLPLVRSERPNLWRLKCHPRRSLLVITVKGKGIINEPDAMNPSTGHRPTENGWPPDRRISLDADLDMIASGEANAGDRGELRCSL